jgi:hypothetical protein
VAKGISGNAVKVAPTKGKHNIEMIMTNIQWFHFSSWRNVETTMTSKLDMIGAA